jgi:hypothetical protein
MGWTTVARDFEVKYGETFAAEWILYADPRVVRFRGDFLDYRVYSAGEAATNAGGEAFVALYETSGISPDEDLAEPFWSPCQQRDVAGDEVLFVCASAVGATPLFTAVPTVPSPSTDPGRIKVEAEPTLFASAPSSEKYFIRVKEPDARVSYAGRGTLLFKQP